MLPISSKIKRHRHKKDENVTRAKLPTQAISKHWPKCPICKAPYMGICSNCGFTHRNGAFASNIKKANESYRREKSMEL